MAKTKNQNKDRNKILADEQRAYYHANKAAIRKRRTHNRLQQDKPVRSSTIYKYDLTHEVKDNDKYDIDMIDPTKLQARIRADVSKEIADKVELRVRRFDEVVADMLRTRESEALNLMQGMPMVDGPMTLPLTIHRMQHMDYKHTSLKGKVGDLNRLFTLVLKDKGEDVIATFNDYSRVIRAVESYTKQTGPNKGELLKSKKNYYSVPYVLYSNMLEFRKRMDEDAFLAYKQKYKEDEAVGEKRKQEVIKNTKYPALADYELVRRNYANEMPGTIWHLVASLYTLEDSQRNDYGCVLLINNKTQEDVTFTAKYLRVNTYNTQTGEFRLAKFKTSKTYGTNKIIWNKRLQAVVALWLKRSGNKKWLITKANFMTNLKKKAETQKLKGEIQENTSCGTQTKKDGTTVKKDHLSGFGKLLSTTFQFYMNSTEDAQQKKENKIGFSELRYAWAGWQEANISDPVKREQAARKMGHSLEMQRSTYVRNLFEVDRETKQMNKLLPDWGDPSYFKKDSEGKLLKTGQKKVNSYGVDLSNVTAVEKATHLPLHNQNELDPKYWSDLGKNI